MYVERGRYETPLVPREDRWCVFCFTRYGLKPIENECHVLLNCKLYDPIKTKNLWLPSTTVELYDTLSNPNITPDKYAMTGKLVHEILEINQHFTLYQNSQDFYNNTGECVLL